MLLWNISILTAFEKADLPEPVFEELWEGVMVTFLKDICNEEYLKKKGLTTRQIKGLVHIKQFGRITNGDYQRINETSERTATRDLQELVEMRLIIKAGSTGKGPYYFLK